MTYTNEVMKIVRDSHSVGTILFEEGEAADHLNVLVEGSVCIGLGELSLTKVQCWYWREISISLKIIRLKNFLRSIPPERSQSVKR